MLSLSDPARFRRRLGGISLVAGPIALGVSLATKVVNSDDARTMLDSAAAHHERLVASNAAQLAAVVLMVPATIAVLGGRLKVGLTEEELLLLATDPDVDKVSTRDLPVTVALGRHGATTVATTMRIAALAGIRASEAGLASGLINTSQQIGGALGIAALSTIATTRTGDAIASGVAQPAALVDGFTAAFAVGAVIAAIGIVATLVLIRREELAPVAHPQTVEPQPALEYSA